MDADVVVSRSPVMLQALRLLETSSLSLSDISTQLKKTKPSTCRAIHRLNEMRVVKIETDPSDKRLRVFSVRDKKFVRQLLSSIDSRSNPPENFRAMPFVMSDLERMLREALKLALPDWNVTNDKTSRAFVLQKAGRAFRVVLKLVIGGKYFLPALLETIGSLAVFAPPNHMMLVVLGHVPEKEKELGDAKLNVGLVGPEATLITLWVEKGPMSIQQSFVNDQIVSKVVALCDSPQIGRSLEAIQQ